MPKPRIAPRPQRNRAVKPKSHGNVSAAKPISKKGGKDGGDGSGGGEGESKAGAGEHHHHHHHHHKKRKRGGRKKKRSPIMKVWRKLFPGSDRPEMNKTSSMLADVTMLTNKELATIKHMFDEVDIDGEGDMDFDEFFEALAEERTPFTDAIFLLLHDKHSNVMILDPEKERIRAAETGTPAQRVSGSLNFNDFIQLCCTYCMYTRDDILMFAFQAFDRDGSGVIDEDEFIELCATVNNMNPTYPGNFKRAMEEFDKNEDGMIDFEEFCSLNRRYPLVLFPAFRLQDALQRYSLGEDTWKEVCVRNKVDEDVDKYRRAHDGRFPDVPMGTKIKRMMCGCVMGADMDKLIKRKHRAMTAGYEKKTSAGGALGDPDKKKKKKKKKAGKTKYYTG